MTILSSLSLLWTIIPLSLFTNSSWRPIYHKYGPFPFLKPESSPTESNPKTSSFSFLPSFSFFVFVPGWKEESQKQLAAAAAAAAGSSMEGLKVSSSKMVVYVHPSKSNKVSQTILRELSSLLFKFSEVFDGIVLAYVVTELDGNAKILTGIHPFFGVSMKAKLLLFNPKPDMLIEGKVVKLGRESLHAIVLGFSSASIMEEDIREEFKYKDKHGEEVFGSNSHKRHVIKVGSIIRFMVKSMDEEILHISGSLIPSHTGNISWLAKHMEEGLQLESNIKRGSENERGKAAHDRSRKSKKQRTEN